MHRKNISEKPDLDPRATNPVKHGAFAKTPLLPGEDIEERKALDRSYREAFKPTSQPEEDIVREMAELVWRRTRLSRAEMAMKNAAVANAGRHLPEAIAQLTIEIRRMELELRILAKLLSRLQAEVDNDDGSARQYLCAIENILLILLGRHHFDSRITPKRVLADGQRIHDARQGALDGVKRVLKDMMAEDQMRMEAAKADASLLEPQKAARILQEHTTLTRAIERQVKLYWDLHGRPEDVSCGAYCDCTLEGCTTPSIEGVSDANAA